MKSDALQTFKSISNLTRKTLGEILADFRTKYIKPQSVATAKHKSQKLIFNPSIQNSMDFHDELQKLDKNAFRVVVNAIIEQFIYSKMPTGLKKKDKPAQLGKWHLRTYWQKS